MTDIQVDANQVIAALRNQLSTAQYELAVMTARAEQAEKEEQ